MSNNLPILPLIIYQNTHFTDSLYSVLFGGIANSQLEKTFENITEDVKLNSGLNLSVPIMSKPIGFKAEGDAKYNTANANSIERDVKITESYKFEKIKSSVSNSNKYSFTEMKETKDFSKLQIGSFIECSSSYRKNDIRELLEILDDDLVELIFPHLYIPNEDLFHKIKTTNTNKDKELKLKQVKNIIKRLKKDFPEESISLDFYGKIKNTDIQNVLICDSKFFVQEDRDRILDGSFKVFGKVIDISEENTGDDIIKSVSLLDRNKLFKRIKKSTILQFQKLLKGSSFETINKFINMDVNLVLEGKNIKILPIVIYI